MDSDSFPIRVHAPSGDWSERSAAMLAILEDAWSRQVEQQGFPAPMEDGDAGGDARLDVYIGLTTPAAALTLADAPRDGNGLTSATSAYIVVDAGLDSAELAPVLHHEFAHVIQFGIDLRESLMFFEASAVAQEYFWDREHDFASLSWAQDIPDFQNYPNASVFLDGIGLQPIVNETNFFEYGAVLFFLFLEQEYGAGDGTLLRALWLASNQPGDAADNEPDWLDALHERMDVPTAILRFSQWRSFIASRAFRGAGLQGGELLSGTSLVRVRRLLNSAFDGTKISLTGPNRVMPLGCFIFALSDVSTLEQDLRLQITMPEAARADAGEQAAIAENADFGVVLWREPNDQAASQIGQWHNEGAESLQIDFQLNSGEEVWGALCDTRVVDADQEPTFSSLELRLGLPTTPECAWTEEGCDAANADGGRVTNNDAGSDEPPAGTCACQTTRGGTGTRSMGWLILSGLGLLIFLARFRKAMLRRKMYREGLGGKRRPPPPG